MEPQTQSATAPKKKATSQSKAALRRQIADLRKQVEGQTPDPALNVNPRAKARTTEVHSSEHTIEQPPPLSIPGFHQPLPEKPSSIQAVDSPLTKEYQAALAFAEDPVTIMVTPSQEENAAQFKECWVNGRGIEVLIGNAWQEWKAIPTGAQIVTKRKYVEVLLRAKIDRLKTNVIRHEHHEDNLVTHNLVLTNHLSHVHDPAGISRGTKGGEWFHRLVATQN